MKDKASDGSSWRLIVTNMSIFKFAHTMAGKHRPAGSLAMPDDRIIGLDAFKQFLVHLFVLSILWVHFKHADQWKEGQDAGNEKLNFNEFKMACRSFSSAQANEELSDAKIAADFKLLDIDQSGYLDFYEVCPEAVVLRMCMPTTDFSTVFVVVIFCILGVHLLLQFRGHRLRREVHDHHHASHGAHVISVFFGRGAGDIHEENDSPA